MIKYAQYELMKYKRENGNGNMLIHNKYLVTCFSSQNENSFNS